MKKLFSEIFREILNEIFHLDEKQKKYIILMF